MTSEPSDMQPNDSLASLVIRAFVTAIYPAAAVTAAVFVLVNQRSLEFLHPLEAYVASISFAIGMLGVASAVRAPWPIKSATFYPFLIVLVTSSGALWLLIGEAAGRASIRDRRCLMIEQDMLSASPSRDDLADIFAAYSCRSQSFLHLQRPRR